MLEQLQAFLRDAPVLMASVDGDLRCHELSPAWRDLLGINRETQLTLGAAELFDSVDQVRIAARLRFTVSDGRAVRGLVATLNTASRALPVRLWAWRGVSPEGRPWCVITAFEIVRGHSGDAPRMLSVHQQILEAAGEGICGVDDLGRTTFLNARATQLLGDRGNEIIGQPMHDVMHHSKPDGTPNPRETSSIRAAYKEGLTATVDDEVFWCPDGSALPVEYTATPIWNKDRLAGAVVVFRDSSEVRRLETEQDAARSEIEQLQRQLEVERAHVREQIRTTTVGQDAFIVESRTMRKTLEQVTAVAGTPSNVLLLGEPGTGKETLALHIHIRSARHYRPLVIVKCAKSGSDPEHELFGSESGEETVLGRWQLASDATLLLDEVGELSRRAQDRLVASIDEAGQSDGGAVRIIATSSRDLENDVRSGRFSERLFDRLSVFMLRVPALRERPEDVPPLAAHFLARVCEGLGHDVPRITRQQLLQLKGHTWAANVRELHNVIEHAAILTRGDRLRLDLALPVITPKSCEPSPSVVGPSQIRTETELRSIEKANMIAALRHCHGRVSGPDGAAKLLGLKASTLAYRMKNFGIEREDLGTYKARLSDFSTKNYSDRERWQSVQSDSSPQ